MSVADQETYRRTIQRVFKYTDREYFQWQTDLLNTKVSALLTHVSVMIAVCTGIAFMAGAKGGEAPLLQMAFLVEVVAYIAITVPCLRILWLTSSSTLGKLEDSDSGIVDALLKRVAERRIWYISTLIATVVVTGLFTLTLAWKLILMSGRFQG